ncbi:hypothetical protein Q5M85_05855 [Paraclostridium bifermentans]|nr:hypothetical protein [Paraclostridium bifermentans]
MTCFIYLIMMKFNLGKISITNVLTICISMYLPILTLILVGRYIKYKNEVRRDVIDTFKIIGISLLEWITTITLVYSIVIILGENISIAQFFPIFVAAIAVSDNKYVSRWGR